MRLKRPRTLWFRRIISTYASSPLNVYFPLSLQSEDNESVVHHIGSVPLDEGPENSHLRRNILEVIPYCQFEIEDKSFICALLNYMLLKQMMTAITDVVDSVTINQVEEFVDF